MGVLLTGLCLSLAHCACLCPARCHSLRACALTWSGVRHCGGVSVVLGKNSGEKHLEIMSEWVRVLCRQLEYVPQDFFRTLSVRAATVAPRVRCCVSCAVQWMMVAAPCCPLSRPCNCFGPPPACALKLMGDGGRSTNRRRAGKGQFPGTLHGLTPRGTHPLARPGLAHSLLCLPSGEVWRS